MAYQYNYQQPLAPLWNCILCRIDARISPKHTRLLAAEEAGYWLLPVYWLLCKSFFPVELLYIRQ